MCDPVVYVAGLDLCALQIENTDIMAQLGETFGERRVGGANPPIADRTDYILRGDANLQRTPIAARRGQRAEVWKLQRPGFRHSGRHGLDGSQRIGTAQQSFDLAQVRVVVVRKGQGAIRSPIETSPPRRLGVA